MRFYFYSQLEKLLFDLSIGVSQSSDGYVSSGMLQECFANSLRIVLSQSYPSTYVQL